MKLLLSSSVVTIATKYSSDEIQCHTTIFYYIQNVFLFLKNLIQAEQ